jgi:hypothetical protein
MDKFKKLLPMLLTAIVIGQGYVPQGTTMAQGELLARRAAIVDAYRQLGGSQGIQILDESFDGKIYTVKAVK